MGATGDAWANVLFGDHNPAGKLPVMMPATLGDIIDIELHDDSVKDVPYSEGMLTSYRSPLLKAAFPFGHGLSYTSFTYSPIRVFEKNTTGFSIGINVTNAGKRTGSDVV